MRFSKSYLALLSAGLCFSASAAESDISVPSDEYPQNVLLNAPYNNFNQTEEIARVCNATVFAHKWVLTAEHCVLSEPRLADNGILDCESDGLSDLQVKACSEALPIVKYGDESENNGWVNVGFKRAISTYIDTTDSTQVVEELKLLNPLNANFQGTLGENVYSKNLLTDSPQAIAFIEMVEEPTITGTGYFAIPSEYDFALNADDELTLVNEAGEPVNYFQVVAYKDTVTEGVAEILGTEAYDPFTYDPLKTNGVTFKPLEVELDVSRGGDYFTHDENYVGLASNLYTYETEDGEVTRGYGSSGAFRSVNENYQFDNLESAFGNGGAAVTRLTENGDYDIVGVLYGTETHSETTIGSGDSSCAGECQTYGLMTFSSLRYEPARNRLLHYVNAINAPKVIRSNEEDGYTTQVIRLQNLSKGPGVGLLEDAQPRNIREIVQATGDVTILDYLDKNGMDETACTEVNPFESCYLLVDISGSGSIAIGFEDGDQPNQSIVVLGSGNQTSDVDESNGDIRPYDGAGSLGIIQFLTLFIVALVRRKS